MSNFITANSEFCGTLRSAPRSELSSCLNQAGNFLGTVTDYRLELSPMCKAIAIRVYIRIERRCDNNEGVWYDYSAPGVVITEQFRIVRCNGTVVKEVVDELCRFANWDGDLSSIRDRTWRPQQLQFDIP